MQVLFKQGFLFLCGIFFLSISIPPSIQAQWYGAVYHAVLAGPGIEDAILFSAEFDTSYQFSALAIGKRFYEYSENLVLELEGQVVKHFGDQTHIEWNGVFILRWMTFPWDQYVNTTFAFGEGLSYASKTPNIEQLHNENVSHLLNYLLIELTVEIPQMPNFSFITRVHHRSGAYGLFHGVKGASNGVGLGIRYDF